MNGDMAASPQAFGDEVESYREWRLQGQPNGNYPFYDMTFHDDERTDALKHIWSKIQSGEYPWRDAKLQSREVRITRTAWQDETVSAEGPERSDPEERP